MPITVPEKEYEVPPDGKSRAVLVDVIDEGEQPDKFNPGKKKHQARFVFELEAKRKDGTPHLVSEWCSLTWGSYQGKESKLTGLAQGLLGRVLTIAERKKFDIESLKGTACFVNIVYKITEKGQRGRVAGLSPYVGTNPLKASGTYKRFERNDTSHERGTAAQTSDPTVGWENGDDASDMTDLRVQWLETVTNCVRSTNTEIAGMADKVVRATLNKAAVNAPADLNDSDLENLAMRLSARADEIAEDTGA